MPEAPKGFRILINDGNGVAERIKFLGEQRTYPATTQDDNVHGDTLHRPHAGDDSSNAYHQFSCRSVMA
jgi:hypothetical protein